MITLGKASHKNYSDMTLEQIDKNITAIRKRGSQLKVDAHHTLVAVIKHYIEHGDFTRLEPLSMAVKVAFGNSVLQSFNQWVQDYVTSLSWDDEAKFFVHIKKATRAVRTDVILKDKSGEVIFSGHAYDLPFYELEKPADTRPVMWDKALITLLKKANKALEQEKLVCSDGVKGIRAASADDLGLLAQMNELVVKAGYVKAEELIPASEKLPADA